MLPAVALLAGCAVSVMGRYERQASHVARSRMWPVWGYGLILAAAFAENRNIWFELTPEQASHTVYRGNPFPEAETVAAFIRTNSASHSCLAVLGSEPEIYFLSCRHSATGYIYTYPLMEPQPYAAQMQQEMIREIESAQPDYVVLIISVLSWLPHTNSQHLVSDWWKSYQTNYTLTGIVDVTDGSEPHSVWGPAAAGHRLSSFGGIGIYKRNPPP